MKMHKEWAYRDIHIDMYGNEPAHMQRICHPRYFDYIPVILLQSRRPDHVGLAVLTAAGVEVVQSGAERLNVGCCEPVPVTGDQQTLGELLPSHLTENGNIHKLRSEAD